MSIITDGSTAENAFNAGTVDVDANCCPVADIPKLKQTPFWRLFSALGTYYYGVNVKNIPNVNQRHAMALAINRRDIIDRIAQGNQQPARGFTPAGISGGPTILANSHLPATPNYTEAKALMAKVSNPVRNIHLYINNSPGHINIAVAVQSYWKQLGLDVTIKTMEWKQYLQFLGPPPNSDVDVYRLGWIADYPDAYNFLSLWECNSGNNNTNFCNSTFDKTVERAGRTQSVQARLKLYRAAETILTGNNGQFPILPIYWYTFHDLVKTYVHGYFENPMGQYDYSKVSLR
jgi:ABC-type oligopeptide transport system substrate-binding subunit